MSMTQEKGPRDLSFEEYQKRAMHHRYCMDKHAYYKKAKERETSEFNRTQFAFKEQQKVEMRKQKRSSIIRNLNGREDNKIQSNLSAAYRTIYNQNCNPIDYDHRKYSTANRTDFSQRDKYPDFYSKNYNKRKSNFKQWSEALYNNGVHFNPPVNGL